MDTAAIFLIWFQSCNNANKLALKNPDLVIRPLFALAFRRIVTAVGNLVTYVLYTY